MKVITLHQPWAFFIAYGWKTIETRTHNRFKGLVRQTIGIHAGKHWDKDWEKLAGEYLTGEQIRMVKNDFPVLHKSLKGTIICTAEVWDAQEVTSCQSKFALINCDPQTNGEIIRHGLFLTNITKIIPIKTTGKQGIWYYSGEIKYL